MTSAFKDITQVVLKDKTIDVNYRSKVLNGGQSQEAEVKACREFFINEKLAPISSTDLLNMLYCFRKTKFQIDSKKERTKILVSDKHSERYEKMMGDYGAMIKNDYKLNQVPNETNMMRAICATRYAECQRIYNTNNSKLSGSHALPYFMTTVSLIKVLEDQLKDVKVISDFKKSSLPVDYTNLSHLAPLSLYVFLDSPNPLTMFLNRDGVEVVFKALKSVADYMGIDVTGVKKLSEMISKMQVPWRECWSYAKSTGKKDYDISALTK